MIYEILDKEKTAKMSDRELELSLSHYSHNLNILRGENRLRNEPLTPELEDQFEGVVEAFSIESKPKKRGRKKKQ